jgi:hypothetical protein
MDVDPQIQAAVRSQATAFGAITKEAAASLRSRVSGTSLRR